MVGPTRVVAVGKVEVVRFCLILKVRPRIFPHRLDVECQEKKQEWLWSFWLERLKDSVAITVAGRIVGRAIHAEGKVWSSVLGTLRLRGLRDTHVGMLCGSGYVSLKVGER